MRRLRDGFSVCLGALVLFGCSASGDDDLFNDTGGAGGGTAGGGGSAQAGGGGWIIPTDDGGAEAGDDCAASAKLIYLVSVERGLWSFDPTIPGLAAYQKVGDLNCPALQDPQSMSVDRSGTAWVFYSSGELFHVSTLDASCQPTTYQHPVMSLFNQLGMGFTAGTPGSKDQILYIISPDFGLATIDTIGLGVNQTGAMRGTAAELTGGPDAVLFMFEANSTTLFQVDRTTLGQTPMHSFGELQGTMAWAFGRYAGDFYLFTATGGPFGGHNPTRTTIYNPVTDQSTLRDANVGFTVVGAGQSTCVPPPPPR